MGRSPSSDKNGLKKGPWTPEEDTKLIQYIEAHGAGNWRNLPKNAGLERCGKSCRLRWTNYLRTDIKRGRFSFDEEETIIQLHSVLGNKWSAIAARLPGRTDNEIKNYWNTHVRKRLLRSGIDPITHAPRLGLDLLLRSPHLNLLRLLNHMGALPIQPNNHFQYNTNQQIPPNLNFNTTNSNFSQETNNSIIHNIIGIATDHQSPLLPTDFCYGVSDQTTADFSQNSTFDQSTSNNNSHDLTFDSVLSTPLSSPPPTLAPSSLINGGGEDDTESFCTSLLSFQIQESWDFDDFL